MTRPRTFQFAATINGGLGVLTLLTIFASPIGAHADGDVRSAPIVYDLVTELPESGGMVVIAGLSPTWPTLGGPAFQAVPSDTRCIAWTGQTAFMTVDEGSARQGMGFDDEAVVGAFHMRKAKRRASGAGLTRGVCEATNEAGDYILYYTVKLVPEDDTPSVARARLVARGNN